MSLYEIFYKMKRAHPRIKRNLWKVLVNEECFSPESAKTLYEIREAYEKLTEDKFPRINDPNVETCFLLTIPFVASFSNRKGTLKFFIVPHNEETP